ncbi:MAG: hypothetical protein P1P84_02735 [Deferrisomatales bacterium]|nr:hypothetical protein [Deferrisomatales bacterium]
MSPEMPGHDKWLDPPDDPPEADEGEWCPKHRLFDCRRCEAEIDNYEWERMGGDL